MGPRDGIILAIGLLVIIGGTSWLSSKTQGDWGTIVFILTAYYVILLAIAFLDYSAGFGLFNNNQVVSTGVIILISVMISVVSTVFAGSIFPSNPDTYSFLSLIILLTASFIISYFILTATPTREGRAEMIRKLTDIKIEIDKLPVGDLGSKEAAIRALKWLEFQQRDDGIWGDVNPLYETSEVLRTFSGLKNGLKHQWKRIVNGKEEIRTVEQTYYLVLEALDTAALESNYEMLLPFLAVTEIDGSQVGLTDEVFIDFEDELNALSEWEFVQSMENFSAKSSPMADIPIIFPMSLILYLKGNYDRAQQCADIFSQTFDILIRRAQTRFSVQEEKEVSKLLIGMMYNSLVTMLRGPRKIETGELLGEYVIDEDVGDSAMQDIDFDLSRLSVDEDPPSSPDLPDFDMPSDSGPSLPSFDFDSDTGDDGFNISLPDMDDLPSQQNVNARKIKIDVSMATIRNYIRTLQSIDGSWGSRLDITAECLLAVLDMESPESEFVKLGLHYLMALQEKNGSWKNDVVLTSKILRVLVKINNSMSLGGF